MFINDRLEEPGTCVRRVDFRTSTPHANWVGVDRRALNLLYKEASAVCDAEVQKMEPTLLGFLGTPRRTPS